jgi:hypothetical protein
VSLISSAQGGKTLTSCGLPGFLPYGCLIWLAGSAIFLRTCGFFPHREPEFG